jgi:signal peptidase I
MENVKPETPILSYASPIERNHSKRGRGFIAVCATFAVTGLGHAIFGRPLRGLVWFISAVMYTSAVFAIVATPRIVPALLFVLPLAAICNLWAIVDAYLCGRRSNRNLLRHPAFRYLAGSGLILLLMIGGRFTNPSLAAAMYFRSHVAEAFIASSRSMSPTLLPRDRVLCNKGMAPSRWSLVVLDSPIQPGTRFIERIVGLPGEKVQIVGSQVCINGIPQKSPAGISPYSTQTPGGNPIGGPGCDAPIALGPEEFYLLGDNSPIAGDSRYWPAIGNHQSGALPASSIVGTITWLYWPPSRWRRLF